MFGLASLTLGKYWRVLDAPKLSTHPTFEDCNLILHRLMGLLVGLDPDQR